MGVPIKGFRVATNQNDILHRLFESGVYAQERVAPSFAPSMDIQVASNFERFLFYSVGSDGAAVRSIMETFKRTSAYVFENFDRNTFSTSRTSDAQITSIIRSVYADFGYVVDPHTACGFTDLNAEEPTLVLSTAHPAKFPDTLEESIGILRSCTRL